MIRLTASDVPGHVLSLEEVILRQACELPLGPLRLYDDACGVLMLSTPGAGILRGVSGLDEAVAVAGVTGVTIAVPVGESVTPLPEGDRYLGFIFARGDAAGDVEAALRAGAVAASRGYRRDPPEDRVRHCPLEESNLPQPVKSRLLFR